MCYFAHPTDLEQWRSARPSGEPPLQYLTDDEYRLIVGRHRSPGRLYGHPPRHRSLSADRDRRRRERERSPGRRRSGSREREPTLAARLRSRRSVSRERAEGRQPVQRSSRSRSPHRGRLLRASSPSQAGPSTHTRAYGAIPSGPRNGPGTPRLPAVFPKVEATDVQMRDLAAKQPVRDSSIASTHVPSHQPTPASIVPVPLPGTLTQLPTTSETTPQGSLPPSADAIKSMLESSQLQWQQISSAVAAATSAVPKPSAQNATDISVEEKYKIWTSRIE